MSREPLEFRFPPQVDHLRMLRRTVRERFERLAMPEALADTVLLVIDEIVTNSIEHVEHFRGGKNEDLVVRLAWKGSDVLLTFEDPDVPEQKVVELKKALRECRGNPPPPEFERGRGLFLVADSIRDLRIEVRAAGGLHLSGRFSEELA